MKYIPRDLETTLASHLATPSDHIILLSGARQTGKSTLIENLPCPEKKILINLWDEERTVIALRNARTFSEFERILKTVFGFVPGSGDILIIDEAQASEHIGSFIMQMHRQWKKQKVVFLGSLLANLYKRKKPLPVGRTVEFICRPLNFREFLRFRDRERYLELVREGDTVSPEVHALLMDEYRAFLQLGGLPGIVAAERENMDVVLLFESLLNNLYRDADRCIRANEDNPSRRTPQYGRIMETVMQAIAGHLGSSTQNATLLSTDSPAYRTVLPLVIEALTFWHLAYIVPFQTAQATSKKGYNSKKYLFDTGVANFLLTRLMPVRFGENGSHAAMLLENGVLQDCISCVESINAIRCYRSNNRVPTELDFTITRQGKTIPLEVKSSSTVKRNALSQLVDFLERSGRKTGYVVYAGIPKSLEFRGKTIRFLPPYLTVDLVRDALA